MIYGYIRVSTAKQDLGRQRANIERHYPEAVIYEEKYTGKTDNRPVFQKLIKTVKKGDVVVFDEVSRMSRNAEEGFLDYKDLFGRGIELKFLKTPAVNSDVYREALATSVQLTGDEIADVYIEATNKVLMMLAERQIRAAFEQAEQERNLLSKRTKEGMLQSRKKPGRVKGVPQHTKKEATAKRLIRKYSKVFGGFMSNVDIMKKAGISAPTFYKYVRQMKEDASQRQMKLEDLYGE